ENPDYIRVLALPSFPPEWRETSTLLGSNKMVYWEMLVRWHLTQIDLKSGCKTLMSFLLQLLDSFSEQIIRMYHTLKQLVRGPSHRVSCTAVDIQLERHAPDLVDGQADVCPRAGKRRSMRSEAESSSESETESETEMTVIKSKHRIQNVMTSRHGSH